MARHVDYYFSTPSPWTFMGHAPFMDLVRTYGLDVAFRPVALGPVFAETGGLPLPKRAPPRQRYRLLELQRWRVKRGVELHVHPRFWPFDATRADLMVIAAVQAGLPVDAFLRRIFSGVWQRQENLADPAHLAAIADEAGLPGSSLALASEGEAAASAYAENRGLALAADVFGAPSYVLDGEVFWGQDRLDLLADALASGRAPYKPIQAE